MLSLPSQKLKTLLVGAGIVDDTTFDTLEQEAERQKQNIADLLVSRNLISKEYLFTLIAKDLGVPLVKLGEISLDEDILRLLPKDIARQRHAVVFGRTEDGRYQVAMADPTDLETIDFLRVRLQGPIDPFLVSDDDLNHAFSLYEQKLTEDFKQIIEKSVKESLRSKAQGEADLAKAAAEVPIVAIVDNMLAYAFSLRASDIHLEILEDSLLLRYRIDGIMREIIRIPKEVHAAIVARVKILSRLRIDEHTRPQDGRFRYRVGDEPIDLRVSVIPTYYGEKVVMRLLSAAQKPLSFRELGILEDMEHVLRDALSKGSGMILVCGPTGSGKTTTLYSFMNVLNRPEVNIITIEDPIEYDMRYVNQVQVNPAAGITFASGLRSILRQDPDIIMVGEIRDDDTANISVQAALTGHLVLSSLHTNDAPTAVPRLMDMGIPQFLITSVLHVSVAQRLTRRICLACIESYKPDEKTLDRIAEYMENVLKIPRSSLPKNFYRGKGCNACGGTGYKGRLGIYEIMNVSEKLREVIGSSSFTLDLLRKTAREEGMITMFEDGLRKVELGLTTIEEVFRVVRD